MFGIDQKILNQVVIPTLDHHRNSKRHELIIYRTSNIEQVVNDLINCNSGLMVNKSKADGKSRTITFSNGKTVSIVHVHDIGYEMRGYRCGKISFVS